MPKAKDHFEKNISNTIIHNYDYCQRDEDAEIDRLWEELRLAYVRKGARIKYIAPVTHPVFDTTIIQPGKIAEITRYYEKDGIYKWASELAYIENVTYNADVTALIDKKQSYVRHLSDDNFVVVDCVYHGDKAIIRLGGVERKELE